MAVKNISKNNPRTGLIVGANRVVTYNGPGKIAWIIAAAVMAPRHWDTESKAARIGVMTPTRARPSETAGLKSPPLIRKNTQALTVRLKPKERAMNCREDVLGACAMAADVVLSALVVVVAPVIEVLGMLATCAP